MTVNFKKIITIAGLENFKERQDAYNLGLFVSKEDITKDANTGNVEIVGTGENHNLAVELLTPDSELTASNIRGVISLDNLPVAAVETIHTVEHDADRLDLTIDQVQTGDTVKSLESGKLYLVVNDQTLADGQNQADPSSFMEYTAGSASSVPWSGVLGKPDFGTEHDDMARGDHTHGSDEVVSMSGYEDAYAALAQDQEDDPAEGEIAITDSDSLNEAVSKLAYMLQFATNAEIDEGIFNIVPEPEEPVDPDPVDPNTEP